MIRSATTLFVVAICFGVLGGCGGENDGNSGAASEEKAVLDAIDGFYLAFTHAEGAKACALLTPKLRSEFLNVAVKAVPSLKGKSCGRVFLGFYRRVPPKNAPRAITLAQGDTGPPTIKLEGSNAAASYKSGGQIRLQRLHGEWLISEAELLPTPTPGQVD